MDALECEGNNAIRILHRNHKAATLAEYCFIKNQTVDALRKMLMLIAAVFDKVIAWSISIVGMADQNIRCMPVRCRAQEYAIRAK
jgi:hypothetical protein